MKTCIFIVGDRHSGKTSIVRSLTGVTREGLWDVKNRQGTERKALVLVSAITERCARENPPNKFPSSIEKEFGISRNDYDILICPFELRTWEKYSLDKYIDNATIEGFTVKVAIIRTTWDGQSSDIQHIEEICRQKGLTPLILDASNDYNPESAKIRTQFYH